MLNCGLPDLKFRSAHGEMLDEALREVQVAKEPWLTGAKAHKQRVSKPKYRPAIYA